MVGDETTDSIRSALARGDLLAAYDEVTRGKLLQACRLYAAVYRRTRSSYPAINAATLAQIAGRPGIAQRLAKAVVQQVLADGGEDYFSLATLAEALVILGDLDGADDVLR